MKIIIFDFEVYKHDVLLGMYFFDKTTRTKSFIQTWDKELIKKYYFLNKENVWVGHNNALYDNLILEAIIKDKNVYAVSQDIIKNNSNKKFLGIKLHYFDLNEKVQVKLKLTEAFWGKKIHMSNIDFDIDRPLTDIEKKEIELYNQSDLEQTFDNFLSLESRFDLLIWLANEFELDLSVLKKSISNISAQVLKVKKQPIKEIIPYIFPQLKLDENIKGFLGATKQSMSLMDYYKNQHYKKDKFYLDILGVEHTIGVGGIHGSRNKYSAESTKDETIYYCDVAGYYNLLMIRYNLFSRSMSDYAKKEYERLYFEQLRLKGIDDMKRNAFKTILLAVFGSKKNQYTEFYDPYHFDMITLNGQLFLVDLWDKIKQWVYLIQSNTDGIIFKIKNIYEQKVLSAIKEWEQRTMFTLKVEKIDLIYQRDVNNYLIKKANGKVTVKGEALKYYDTWKNPWDGGSFIAKEPMIISILMVHTLLFHKWPEQTINEFKDELRLFQFICKKDTFDYLINRTNSGDIKIQDISRVFPDKSGEYSTIIKVKKDKETKVANIPDSVFIYNDDIRDKKTIFELQGKIDFDWYIQRTYERLGDFIETKN